MTIVSNSDALAASRDEKSRIVDRIRQHGQWIVSTVRRVDKRWTEARLTRKNLHDLSRLNDHMLRDIGLTRDNLLGATPGRIAGWRSFEPWRD